MGSHALCTVEASLRPCRPWPGSGGRAFTRLVSMGLCVTQAAGVRLLAPGDPGWGDPGHDEPEYEV